MPDKFIREIEEILEQAEHSGKGDASKGTEKSGRHSGALGPLAALSRLGGLFRVSPNKVMLGGIILLVLAFMLNALVPGTVPLFAWAGLVLFVITYGLLFMRPGFQYEKRWRGRLVDDGERFSVWERFRHWLRG